MMHLYFIRHGATPGNLERRYIGRTDEPLSPQGREQLRGLTPPAVDRVLVSPMLRTRQTADLLFPNQPHTPVEGLQETDFGIFEGKTADELSAEPAYQAWVDAYCATPIPGGEAVEDFKDRTCRAFLRAVRQLREEGSAALVLHGGGIMAILEAFALPKRDFYDYHVSNGTLVSCLWDGDNLQVLE